MKDLILVALGGSIGSVFRYLTGLTVQKMAGLTYIPIGTFSVNVIGSFLIGLLLVPHFINPTDSTHDWRMFAIVGFLGGFTTFSAFSGEIMFFLHQKDYLKAFTHFALNNICGVFMAWLGFYIAMKFQS
jgi:CrcB protein